MFKTREEYLSDPYNWQASLVDENAFVSRDGEFVYFKNDVARSPKLSLSIQNNYLRSGIRFSSPTIHFNQKKYTAHVLVAELFVFNPDPDVYTDVLNKSGDANDIRANNLMWVTRNEKLAYDLEHGRINNRPMPKFYECIDDQKTFSSILAVEKEYGVTRWHLDKHIDNPTHILECGKRFRRFEGTERLKYWISDPTDWRVHPKYKGYIVSRDGIVIKRDSDGGLGTVLLNYIRPDGEVWVKTERKENRDALVKQVFG